MNRSSLIKTAATVAGVLALSTAILYWLFADFQFSFFEEVQLSNGQVVEIRRVVRGRPLGEVGGPGGWEARFMSLEVEPAKKDSPAIWQSSSGLVPVLLDKNPDDGGWVLIATFFTCDAWYALGRPKLPYAAFQYVEGAWQKIELPAWTIGKPANVLTSIRSSGEPGRHTLVSKRDRESLPTIAPKFTRILDKWATGC